MSEQNVYASKFWKKNWDPHVKDIPAEDYETTFVEMMKQSFEEYPDKVALSYLGVEKTFRELDEMANKFSNMLIANGFKKGDVVGINLPNTIEYIVTVVGTMKAGCIISGVSPLLSAMQIEYQLSDLGSGGKKVCLVTLDAIFAGHITKIATKIDSTKLIVTTSVGSFLPKIIQILGKALGKIPKGKVTPLEGKTVLDFHKDVLQGDYSTDPPDVKVVPDDIGWIQYTGGTTGPPKGAMLSHRNFAANGLAIAGWLGWEFGKGVLLSGFPMFHIAGLTVAEAGLYFGWTQILIPNPRDTNHIIKEMKKYRPTNLVNVPSLYQMLIKNPKFKSIDHSELGTCISAAAPFPKESQEELESIIGKGKLLELYGMTELSPVATMNPSRGEKKLGTVGMPIQNVDLKIVDPDTSKPVPLGEPGEILVKGPMVMQGYYNKPEETKNAIDADGYMHTGDVGIMSEDSYIRIVDRTKDMIIVGGFKVFSSKVEDILSEHPAIGIVALIGKPNPDRPGSEIVNAYVQLNPDYEYDGNEAALKENLISYAKKKCSPYEVPKEVHIVEELPLTVIGKVDKKVLRK